MNIKMLNAKQEQRERERENKEKKTMSLKDSTIGAILFFNPGLLCLF